MLSRFARHGRDNFVAYLALFIALSGTSYAAIKLPPNSVTSREVKNGTLLGKDFRAGELPGPVNALVAGRAADPLAPPDVLWGRVSVTTTRTSKLFVIGHVDSLSLACQGGPCSVDVGLYLGQDAISHSGRTLTSTCDAGGCRIEAEQQDLIGLTGNLRPGTYDVTLCTKVRSGTYTGTGETGGEIAALEVTGS